MVGGSRANGDRHVGSNLKLIEYNVMLHILLQLTCCFCRSLLRRQDIPTSGHHLVRRSLPWEHLEGVLRIVSQKRIWLYLVIFRFCMYLCNKQLLSWCPLPYLSSWSSIFFVPENGFLVIEFILIIYQPTVGGRHGGGRGRDSLVGVSIKIRLGHYKGCKGRVIDVKGATVRVELESQMKIVAGKSLISLVWNVSLIFSVGRLIWYS